MWGLLGGAVVWTFEPLGTGLPSRAVGNSQKGGPFDDPAADTEILLPPNTCAAGFEIAEGDFRVLPSVLPQTISLGQVTVSFYRPGGFLGSLYLAPPSAPVFTFVGAADGGGITRITIVDDPTSIGSGAGFAGLAEIIDDLRVVECASDEDGRGGPGPDRDSDTGRQSAGDAPRGARPRLRSSVGA